MQGTQISLSVGLVGVLSVAAPSASCSAASPGYYGGRIDFVIQRVIEFILSLPTSPDLAGARRGACRRTGQRRSNVFHDHRVIFRSPAGRS